MSEVGEIRQSLCQLNDNVGRLVTLVGEQLKFFSTQQARGGPPTAAAGGSRHAAGADPPGLSPEVIARLRHRVAHDPEPTELPTTRDPLQNALAVSEQFARACLHC